MEKYVMILGTGTLNTEGDHAHRADEARSFGYGGQGIKVGVLSDSYNYTGTAAASVASGNLPGVGNPLGNTTPVTVLQESGITDEGQAMLQIVHDILPYAKLYFATAYGSEANYAANIKALRAAGCEGGRIDNEGGNIRIANCTIVNNTATKNGGGVTHKGIASYILFSTIVNNVLKPNATGTSVGGGVLAIIL